MTYQHEYYLKNKQKYIERNKKWREENKEKFYELVKKYRTQRANKLKEKGEIYVWRSGPERERLYEKRNRRINQDNREREIQNKGDESR